MRLSGPLEVRIALLLFFSLQRNCRTFFDRAGLSSTLLFSSDLCIFVHRSTRKLNRNTVGLDYHIHFNSCFKKFWIILIFLIVFFFWKNVFHCHINTLLNIIQNHNNHIKLNQKCIQILSYCITQKRKTKMKMSIFKFNHYYKTIVHDEKNI